MVSFEFNEKGRNKSTSFCFLKDQYKKKYIFFQFSKVRPSDLPLTEELADSGQEIANLPRRKNHKVDTKKEKNEIFNKTFI